MTVPNEVPEEEQEEELEALTAPNNLDVLRDEMVISINLYLEALSKIDSENTEDSPRLIPVDWAVIMTGFPDTGEVDRFYYRMDASGPPHTQVGMARILSVALET